MKVANKEPYVEEKCNARSSVEYDKKKSREEKLTNMQVNVWWSCYELFRLAWEMKVENQSKYT